MWYETDTVTEKCTRYLCKKHFIALADLTKQTKTKIYHKKLAFYRRNVFRFCCSWQKNGIELNVK